MQIFPRSLNLLPLITLVGVLSGGGAVTLGIWYYFSPKNLQVGHAPEQPIPYSHKLHVGELGLDCRYCHANVETSYEAQVPPTQTCMGCHAVVRKDSPRLLRLRDSWSSGQAVEWVRVHKLPDHVYFDHSVHLAVGVGCVSCHGRIDQMDVVRQDKALSMGWCLDCHRNPEPSLRPKSEITNMTWAPEPGEELSLTQVDPPQNCSGCHR